MFSKVTLRHIAPLYFLCAYTLCLTAQPSWERDAAFGAGGTVRIGGGREEETVKSMALLPGGKILAAGRYGGDLSFIMARYHANGQLDASFGSNGKTAFRLGSHFGEAKEILTLSDGRFILGATGENVEGLEVFSLVRFLADGAPDNTFGTNSVAKGPSVPGLHDKLNAIALQQDGKILAAGSTNYINGEEDQQSVTLQRFSSNGGIDPSFGINGVVRLLYPGQHYEFNAIAVQADGRIVAAGSNSDKILVARFWPNGTVDSTFGINGVKFLQYSAAGKTRCRAVALLPNGKILLGAWCHEYWYNNGAIAIRLLSDGSLDPTFHNGGMSFVHCNYQLNTSSMTLQSDGKIVLAAAGLNNDPWPFTAIFRFQPDGAPDSSFAQNGAWVNPVGNEHSALYNILALPDGKILAGGVAKEFSDFDFTLLRLQNDGTSDAGFGNNGLVFTDFGWGGDKAHGIYPRADGKMLFTGNYLIGAFNSPDNLCALAQLLPDGTADPGFGTGGIDTFTGGSLISVVFQPDGKILAGVDAYFGQPGYLYRRLPNGGADSSFGQFGRVDSVFGNFVGPTIVQAGLLSNGKIIVAGSVNRPGTFKDFILSCFLPDGSRDLSFGDNGFVLMDFNNKDDGVYGLAIQPDDKILLAGNCWNGGVNKKDIVVMRFHANGTFDSAWGQNGIKFDDFGAPIGEGVSYMTFTPAGKLMLAVQCQITVDVFENALFENAVACYNADGTPDANFGNNGKVVIPLNTPYAGSRFIRQIRFLPNGKFVTAAFNPQASLNNDSFAIEIKRYLPNGAADTLPAANSIISDQWGKGFGDFAIEMSPADGIAWLAGSTYFDHQLNEDIILARYRFQPGCFPLTIQSVGETGVDDTQVNISPSPSCPAVNFLTDCDEAEICLCGKDATFIVPYKNDNPLNGVSTFDLVLISKHILGLETFGSPYQIIAADVNKSGSVTTFDIVEIRKLILGIYQNFPNNTSWRFVREDHVFPNPANPFSPPFPEKDTTFGFDPPARLAYRAIKTGDVNITQQTGCDNFFEPEPRQSLSFGTRCQSATAGSLLTVPVFFAENAVCAAWQCALHFDANALELVEVRPGEWKDWDTDNFGLSDAGDGIMRAVWFSEKGQDHPIRAGTVLFRLVFRAKKDIRAEEVFLSTDESVLPSRAYLANGNAVDLSLRNQAQVTEEFAASSVRVTPNPVSGALCFSIENARTAKGELRIYKAGGDACFREIVTWTDNPVLCFSEADSWPPGLYLWQFSGAHGETAEGKFLKM